MNFGRVLGEVPFLYNSTFAMQITVETTDILLKGDVKDFYMSVQHENLAFQASRYGGYEKTASFGGGHSSFSSPSVCLHLCGGR